MPLTNIRLALPFPNPTPFLQHIAALVARLGMPHMLASHLSRKILALKLDDLSCHVRKILGFEAV